MPDGGSMNELGRKLLRQGFPRPYIAGVVREIFEHREDLEREAQTAGLTRETARSVASEKLGDIDELARALLATRRGFYWWGRHPLITFVALPLPVFLLLFLGLVWLGAQVSGVAAWSAHRDSLPEPDWAMITAGFYAAFFGAIALTAVIWCHLARRCCCGLKWSLISCFVIFLHGLFFHAGFSPPHGQEFGNFWIGYHLRASLSPELIAWLTPLVVFGGYYFHSRTAVLTQTAE